MGVCGSRPSTRHVPTLLRTRISILSPFFSMQNRSGGGGRTGVPRRANPPPSHHAHNNRGPPQGQGFKHASQPDPPRSYPPQGAPNGGPPPRGHAYPPQPRGRDTYDPETPDLYRRSGNPLPPPPSHHTHPPPPQPSASRSPDSYRGWTLDEPFNRGGGGGGAGGGNTHARAQRPPPAHPYPPPPPHTPASSAPPHKHAHARSPRGQTNTPAKRPRTPSHSRSPAHARKNGRFSPVPIRHAGGRGDRYSPELVAPVAGWAARHEHHHQQHTRDVAAPPPPQPPPPVARLPQPLPAPHAPPQPLAQQLQAQGGGGVAVAEDASLVGAVGAAAATGLPPPFHFSPRNLLICDLEVRYPRLYIPSDFTHAFNAFVDINTLKEHTLRTLFSRTRVSVDNTANPTRTLTNLSSVETGSLAKRFNARVLMVLGLEAGEGDGPDVHEHMRFLMGRRKGNLLLPGGGWVPSLDGGHPEADEKVLIRTAIRSVHQMTGLDLSGCHVWRRLYEVTYHRPEEVVQGKHFPEQEEVTVVFVCDLWRVKPPVSGPGDSTSIDVAVTTLLNCMDDKLVCKMLEAKGGPPRSRYSTGDPRQQLRAVLLREGLQQQQLAAATMQPPQPSSSAAAASTPPHPDSNRLIASPATPEPGHEEKSVSLEVVRMSDLLSYQITDRNERTFEVSLAVELLVCLLARHHGSIIFHAIKNETVYDHSPGAHTPAQSPPTHAFLSGGGLNRLIGAYLSVPPSTPEDDVLSVFLAFRWFDRMGTGVLTKQHLERIFQNLGVPHYSRKDIGKLIERVLVDPSSPATAATSDLATQLDYASVLRGRLAHFLA